MSDENLSILVYGGPGSGKTRFGVSAFWDFKKHVPLCNGRLIDLGREYNPAIESEIPTELVKRFSLDADPSKYLNTFTEIRQYIGQVIRARDTKDAIDVLVFDGITEWNQMYQLAFEGTPGNAGADKFAKWDGLQREFRKLMQMLDPRTLGATIITTAMVGGVRKELTKRDGTVAAQGDPDWMQDVRYFPDIQGSAKNQLGRYFNVMSYIDLATTSATVNGVIRTIPQFKFYMVPGTDYWVKNVWVDKWINAGLPDYLTSPTYQDMIDSIERAKAHKGA